MNTHSHSRYQADFTFFRPKPDGDIDPAGEAGWFMQRERERRGLSLEKTGEQCGIHPQHLSGIELGDLTQLPARTEALSLIGQYAQFLGFDPQPLVLHYAQYLPQPIPTRRSTRRKKPGPLSSARILSFPNISRLAELRSGAGGIVASVFAAILLFEGAVYVLSPSSEPVQSDSFAKMAEAETAPLPISAGAPIPISTKAARSDGQIVSSINTVTEVKLDDSTRIGELSRAADEAAGGLSGLTELIQKDISRVTIPLPKAKPRRAAKIVVSQNSTSATSAGATKVTLAAQKPTPGANNAKSRLSLTARETVWVRIEDRQGNVVLTKTLRKGDVYRVPNRDGLVVITRDGGLLNYAIDGETIGTLGDSGEILVGQSLDIASLTGTQG